MPSASEGEWRIRALLERYFWAVDARDEALLASCFVQDATALYHKGFETEAALRGGAEIARFLLHRTSVYSVTTHQIGSARLSPRGEACLSDMFAIAHVVDAARSRILVRGIRYQDDLVEAGGAWRIRHRVHIPQWQYEAASVAPAIPAAGPRSDDGRARR